MNNHHLLRFLGGLSPDIFLKDFWQQRPLFVKKALLKTDHLATPENIKEMAQDENFESRMVWQDPLTGLPCEAQLGPFRPHQMEGKSGDKKKNERKWTLIVHNLELYFKEFRALKNMIDCISSWQFDDIMCTYSLKDACMGAHIDNYNVFIVQGKGRRLWQINERPDQTYHEHLDLKILKNFESQQEFVLEEGDMLYLPPGAAHRGISLTEGLSYSIGLKAFDYENMASAFLSEFLSHYKSSQCLKESRPKLLKNINELSSAQIDDVVNFLRAEVLNREKIGQWFGEYITIPRNEMVPPDEVPTFEEFSQKLAGPCQLYRDEFLRFNFVREGGKRKLFVNQMSFLLSIKDYKVLEKILETSSQVPISLPSVCSHPVKKTLYQLVICGAISD